MKHTHVIGLLQTFVYHILYSGSLWMAEFSDRFGTLCNTAFKRKYLPYLLFYNVLGHQDRSTLDHMVAGKDDSDVRDLSKSDYEGYIPPAVPNPSNTVHTTNGKSNCSKAVMRTVYPKGETIWPPRQNVRWRLLCNYSCVKQFHVEIDRRNPQVSLSEHTIGSRRWCVWVINHAIVIWIVNGWNDHRRQRNQCKEWPHNLKTFIGSLSESMISTGKAPRWRSTSRSFSFCEEDEVLWTQVSK